ncbi:MAG: hypothetical protein A2381_19895 [Bdellovibrionales bacterium RIFOXYB1_FULL_37_110]|nr:MAG: hypothetical protein A2181_03530 [Bdellovibrionales bacterium RIFOXYA1_FULL_38_20]OFZ51107.1 MAG: hypothetical protein A2417_19680 [Bdellovibrionales bacterium RIFOXYC1_FULL_37_79]OFZ60319.1 MAG: hypothetical protein A2381_19895 [Bdellovibrionales bacterium RIFOXYB1_FULL_37_110]OFZ61594.1 MAG: hypothetical protein A2577_10335 [Bdellovibrionales bacterium RIFOXYD1_FULL_36_51]
MKYDQPLFRPPSESNSLLIQITLGCSHNKCIFCGMYQTKKFKVKTLEEITSDIADAKKYYERSLEVPTKAFFCDGDAMAAPFELILATMEIIKKEFPMITRFSIYASALNIIRKDQTQLHLMKQAGLSLCYIGLESGSDEVLQLIKKGNTKEEIILACNRLSDGKIKISLIALLGIGGVGHSLLHAKETAEAVTKIAPEFLSFLTVTVVPHTALDVLIRKNKFSVLSHKELLMEMQAIIEAIELKDKRIIFRANHVSNNFPLAGVLAKDKEKMLGVIRRWIEECPDNTYPDLDYRCL